MIREHDLEVVPGLPGPLPKGERLLWQGQPDWRRLALSAFHVRLVAAYFAALALWDGIEAARGEGSWTGVGLAIGAGTFCVGLLALTAWGSARATMYSLTDRRLVIRGGVALSVCINIPLALIASVDLRQWKDGTGDVPLTLGGQQRAGWLALWPHVRPWRFSVPQPMLRGIADAANVAGLIARTTGTAQGTPVETAPRLAVAA